MPDESTDHKRRLSRALAGDAESTDEVRSLIGHLADQLRDSQAALAKCEEEMRALQKESHKRDARIIALEVERQRLMCLLDETTAAAEKLEQALEERRSR